MRSAFRRNVASPIRELGLVMAHYDQLHVFIDESGDFINLLDGDVLLVGGVLFWGDYNDQVDRNLKRTILDAMHKEYDYEYRCVDYEHLHYHYAPRLRARGNKIYWKEKNSFIAEVRSRLHGGNYWDKLEGFVLQYAGDIYTGAGSDQAEDVLDNRYERMLELLIDSLLTRVLYTGKDRLSPNGAIHLHIASRTAVEYYFDDDGRDRIIRDELEPRRIERGNGPGKYRIDENAHKIIISLLLDQDRLAARVNRILGAHQTRGACDVEIESIHYPNFTREVTDDPSLFIRDADVELSRMGFYLADLFLGQIRNNKRADELVVRYIQNVNYWVYVPTTKLINEIQISLAKGSSEFFWRTVVNYPKQVKDGVFVNFLNNLPQESADLVLKGFPIALARVRDDVDNPGLGELLRFKRVYFAFQEIREDLQDKVARNVLQALGDSLELTNHRVKITLANHLGRSFEALQYVQDYDRMLANPERNVFESFLPEEELEFRTDMAMRCAVTYVDQFEYQRAIAQLESAVALQEKTFEFFNELSSASGRLFMRDTRLSLGRCYGALGQLHAFQGEWAQAIELLNKAIDHIDPEEYPGDIQRDLIYLGHVACDVARDAQDDESRATAAELWRRVAQDLQFPRWDDLAVMQKLADDNRYTFALIVKAMAFFASEAEIRQFLNAWGRSTLIRRISGANGGDAFEHPYELICQSIGVLYERSDSPSFDEELRSQIKRLALQAYQFGYEIAKNGGEIIRLLGLASLARKFLLADASLNEWREWNGELEALLARFNQESVNSVFGAERGAIKSGEGFNTAKEYCAKAKKFIQAIRFNYW